MDKVDKHELDVELEKESREEELVLLEQVKLVVKNDKNREVLDLILDDLLKNNEKM